MMQINPHHKITGLTKDELNRLKAQNNRIAGWHLSVRIGIELLGWLGVYSLLNTQHYLPAGILFWFLCVWHSFWGYAGIGHEFFHQRVFSSKRLNTFFFHFSSILTWSNAELFKKSHGFHHAKPFHKDDHESKANLEWHPFNLFLYLFLDWRLLKNRLHYAIFNAFGHIPISSLNQKHRKKVQISAIQIVFFHFILQLLLYIWLANITFNILVFIAPFFAQILPRFLSQSQHICLEEHKNQGPLAYSRSLKLPKLMEFLYAGMNYHCEHHLYATVPYYHLPKVQQLLLQKGNQINIMELGVYLQAFKKQLRFSCKPNPNQSQDS